MSGTVPPRRPRVSTSITTGPAPQAAQAHNAQQGMIAPMNDFVDPSSGILTPISFRFLYGLFSAIATIEERLNNANIP